MHRNPSLSCLQKPIVRNREAPMRLQRCQNPFGRCCEVTGSPQDTNPGKQKGQQGEGAAIVATDNNKELFVKDGQRYLKQPEIRRIVGATGSPNRSDLNKTHTSRRSKCFCDKTNEPIRSNGTQLEELLSSFGGPPSHECKRRHLAGASRRSPGNPTEDVANLRKAKLFSRNAFRREARNSPTQTN